MTIKKIESNTNTNTNNNNNNNNNSEDDCVPFYTRFGISRLIFAFCVTVLLVFLYYWYM